MVKPEAQEKRLRFDKNFPTVVQLWGEDFHYFYQAAKIVCPMEFAGIDINAGCPNPRVLKRGAGADLIGKFEKVEKIVTACKKAIEEAEANIPLSIKTRICGDENKNLEWLKFLSQLPIDMICLHGRPVEQRLSGSVDWEKIAVGAEEFKRAGIITLGNGGIKSLEEAKDKIQKYNLDGVLIGQAAMGNPWLFDNDRLPTLEERFTVMLEHAQLAQDFYGITNFKSFYKHAVCYCRGFDGAKELRIRILKTKNSEELKNLGIYNS